MTTPSTAVGGMSKSRPIVGSATFTIVMSMMFMNMADTKTMPTAIFWFMRTTATSFFLSGVCARRPHSWAREGSGGIARVPFDPMRSASPPWPREAADRAKTGW